MNTSTGPFSNPSFNAPDNELPVGVPLNAVLARTDDLVVAVTGAQVFSTGVRLTVTTRLRVLPPGSERRGSGWIFSTHHERADGEPDQRFLLGVELADGRTAANVPAGHDDGPELRATSGGGGGTSYDQTYWLTPVPPDGPLTFVCTCGALGLAETRVTVEDVELATVSTRVEVLWPSPPRPTTPRPAPLPALPAGWFSRHVEQRVGQVGLEPTT